MVFVLKSRKMGKIFNPETKLKNLLNFEDKMWDELTIC